jgi:aerotaxis receptor
VLQFSDDTEIISTTDLKGIVDSANEDFIHISGFEWDEIKDKNHNLVRHPDMTPIVFCFKCAPLRCANPFPFLL